MSSTSQYLSVSCDMEGDGSLSAPHGEIPRVLAGELLRRGAGAGRE